MRTNTQFSLCPAKYSNKFPINIQIMRQLFLFCEKDRNTLKIDNANKGIVLILFYKIKAADFLFLKYKLA